MREVFLIIPEFVAVTAAAMCVHPYIHSPHSRERQREMMAQADRQRLARQLSGLARHRGARREPGAARAAPGAPLLRSPGCCRGIGRCGDGGAAAAAGQRA
jgi:hypothetical protein